MHQLRERTLHRCRVPPGKTVFRRAGPGTLFPGSWSLCSAPLQWAFGPPRTSIDADINVLKPKLETRGIGPLITPFMANFTGFSGNGCKGPAIDLSSIHLARTIYPFDACQAPLANIASGVNAFFSLAIVVQGGMSCIRGVASGFGFDWGLGNKGGDV